MNDLISRQAAIDALCDNCDHVQAVCAHYPCKQYIAFEKLPSAQPEQKKGKWLFTDAVPHRVYCSACYKTYIPNKEWIAWAEDIIPKNFCPNCGARMDGDAQ